MNPLKKLFGMTTINYDELDSDLCRSMAKKELPGEDEKLAKEMVALIKNAKKTGKPFESESYKKSRIIGNYLNENGGYRRMLLVARRVEVLSDELSYCEMFWNHIGEWMA